MLMTNKMYDITKDLVTLWIPSMMFLYFCVVVFFKLDINYIVILMVSLFNMLLSAILRTSANNYTGDGVIFVDDSDPDKSIYRMELDSDIDELPTKKSVTFMVKRAILD